MLKWITCLLSLLVLVLSLVNQPLSDNQKINTFLALGDSYTIGESIDEEMRWPNQLTRILNQSGAPFENPHIIAKTGWTTDELLSAINSALLADNYDYVSLLIGVNNQYRGRSVDSFEHEFETLLKKSISLAKGNYRNVFVLSIPDWGAMPFAQDRDRDIIASEIAVYNDSIKVICALYQVAFFDITPISKEALTNAAYVANDQLHPSGAMYSAWVNKVLPFFSLVEHE
jgi:lysophospholipase L1-like esterase